MREIFIATAQEPREQNMRTKGSVQMSIVNVITPPRHLLVTQRDRWAVWRGWQLLNPQVPRSRTDHAASQTTACAPDLWPVTTARFLLVLHLYLEYLKWTALFVENVSSGGCWPSEWMESVYRIHLTSDAPACPLRGRRCRFRR